MLRQAREGSESPLAWRRNPSGARRPPRRASRHALREFLTSGPCNQHVRHATADLTYLTTNAIPPQHQTPNHRKK
jgi:hypothetical protein